MPIRASRLPIMYLEDLTVYFGTRSMISLVGLIFLSYFAKFPCHSSINPFSLFIVCILLHILHTLIVS